MIAVVSSNDTRKLLLEVMSKLSFELPYILIVQWQQFWHVQLPDQLYLGKGENTSVLKLYCVGVILTGLVQSE